MIRALLVDDEERVLRAVKENVHWKVCGIDHLITAADADQANLLFEEYNPEILLTDIEMPGQSGLELIQKVRQERPDTFCLCITCHPEYAYMRKAMQMGSVDYILKPIEYEELEQVLINIARKILRQRDETDKEETGDLLSGNYDEGDRTIEHIKEYITSHLLENISVSVLAEKFYCSSTGLMRNFKKKTGVTVVEYITLERVRKAKQLLANTDLPIRSVAQFSGYEDYSYFTRVFKKETGITPTEYRIAKKSAF